MKKIPILFFILSALFLFSCLEEKKKEGLSMKQPSKKTEKEQKESKKEPKKTKKQVFIKEGKEQKERLNELPQISQKPSLKENSKSQPPKKQEPASQPKEEPPLIIPPLKPSTITALELTLPPSTNSNSLEPQNSLQEKEGLEWEKPKDGLITNVFVNTDMRQALYDIAFQAGKKLILDDTVRGVVNIEIENLPFEEALRQMLIQGGYTYKKFDDYYLIGLLDPENPTFKYLSTTERIKLNFIDPKNYEKFLPKSLSCYVTEDKEQNSLIVNAPSDIIELIRERLKKIDTPPKKVLIEVLATEILKKSGKSLGTDIVWDGKKEIKRAEDIWKNLTFNVKKDAILTIKALAEQGEVRIRANPRILTLEGKSASFSIAKEEYYTTPGTIYQPYTKLDSIKTGITIKVTPSIASDKKIILSIEPEVSDISEIGKDGFPIITRRTTKTDIMAESGETVVIGGLIQESKEERKVGIPGLQRIPLLGKAVFSYKTTKTNTSELAIFITPSIVE